jgi:hypothetical protein
MTERLFSLEEVTAAMSPAFKQAQKETNVDRALRIFTDIAVDRLKALAEIDRIAAEMHEGFASPND